MASVPSAVPLTGEDLLPEDAPAADAGPAVADDDAEHRYHIVITGLDGISDATFRGRFAGLSVLQERRGKPANLAQINRRMRLDAEAPLPGEAYLAFGAPAPAGGMTLMAGWALLAVAALKR